MNAGDPSPTWTRILHAAVAGGIYEPIAAQPNRVHMKVWGTARKGAIHTSGFARQVGPDVRSMVEAGLLKRMPDRTYKPTILGLALIQGDDE